jgi:hypothetical protein
MERGVSRGAERGVTDLGCGRAGRDVGRLAPTSERDEGGWKEGVD